jgi:uncharacterized delta-60 repeat protein
MTRFWRVSMVFGALCVALAAMAVGAAAKPHGGKPKKTKTAVARLDPSFGKAGTFTVATPRLVDEDGAEANPWTRMAVAPSNKSYVLQGQTIVGFGANGKPDAKFGNHGRVSVQLGPGKVLSLAGIAVDSQGRVLVAGTYEPFPGFKNPIAKGEAEHLFFGDEPATEAFVVRYLPTGKPDPTFGNAGFVFSSLGVPRPSNEPFGEKAPTAEYERPVVTVSGIVVDSQDRPVLSGAYVYAQRTCFYKQQYKHSTVARLTTSGTVDTSFGSGGYATIPGEEAFALTGGPNGEWVAFGNRERACKSDVPPFWSSLGVLSEAGTPAALSPTTPTPVFQGAVAVDGQGRILYAEGGSNDGESGEASSKITRLLPNGEVDRSFGHEGGIVLTRFLPGAPAALTVDQDERVVVGLAGNSKLELSRLTSAGKLEGNFGNHGLLSGPGDGAELEGVAIDSKGRILVSGHSGTSNVKSGWGITIARFLPGK